jgi:hypothetical protein
MADMSDMSGCIVAYSPGLMDPVPEEKTMDKKERRIATRGKGKSSLWLPGNLLCNSRYYVDPELKAKYTSEVRNVTNDPKLSDWKRQLEAERNSK